MGPVFSIAQPFHAARRAAKPLEGFPGTLPKSLADAFAVQKEAIASWPDTVRGWKDAAIRPDLWAKLGAMRLSGPSFSRGAHHVAPGETVDVPVIRDGFIAAETEIAIVLGRDLAPRSEAWDTAALLPVTKYLAILFVCLLLIGFIPEITVYLPRTFGYIH